MFLQVGNRNLFEEVLLIAKAVWLFEAKHHKLLNVILRQNGEDFELRGAGIGQLKEHEGAHVLRHLNALSELF